SPRWVRRKRGPAAGRSQQRPKSPALRACKARAWLPVLGSWRAEHVEHAGALRTGTHGMGDVARGAPEVPLLYGDLLTVLHTHGGALQKHAPLLFGVLVQHALSVGGQAHDREHRLLAGKNPRRHAGTKLAE